MEDSVTIAIGTPECECLDGSTQPKSPKLAALAELIREHYENVDGELVEIMERGQ